MKMSDFQEVTNLRGQLNTIRLLIDKIGVQDPVRLFVSPPTGTDVFMFASHKNMMELLAAEALNLVIQLRGLGVEVDE